MKTSEKSREIQELEKRRKKEVAEYKDRVDAMTKQQENEKQTHASTVNRLKDEVDDLERQVGIQCLVIFLLKTFYTGLTSLKDLKHF